MERIAHAHNFLLTPRTLEYLSRCVNSVVVSFATGLLLTVGGLLALATHRVLGQIADWMMLGEPTERVMTWTGTSTVVVLTIGGALQQIAATIETSWPWSKHKTRGEDHVEGE